jgi:hypothetical protein
VGEAGIGVVVELGAEVAEAAGGGGLVGQVLLAALLQALGFGGGQEQGPGLSGAGQAGRDQGRSQLGQALGVGAAVRGQLGLQRLMGIGLNGQLPLLVGQLGLGELLRVGQALGSLAQLLGFGSGVGAGVVGLAGGLLLAQGLLVGL